ncbi:MAG: hypothetical protein KDJ36_05525 [Hyphomicrobiaceae bacterium]|nr:hypothetical protein [Hyphomicrobiaceae bacterium]
MRRTNRKLSGPSLERFLLRFFRAQPGIDGTTADRLTRAASGLFASVRVRRVALRPPSRDDNGQTSLKQQEEPASSTPKATTPDPRYAKIAASLNERQPASAPPPPAPFDPYAFGLVPTYQRQGAEGLRTKLADITELDNLRKLARAQQIILPLELRSGESEIDAVREGIVTAVEKRIADRRAAAG